MPYYMNVLQVTSTFKNEEDNKNEEENEKHPKCQHFMFTYDKVINKPYQFWSAADIEKSTTTGGPPYP